VTDKLISLQLTTLFKEYVKHVTPIQHVQSKFQDARLTPAFRYTGLDNSSEAYIIQIFFGDSGIIDVVAEVSLVNGVEVTNAYIDTFGKIATFGQLQEIVADVAYEIFVAIK